MGRLKESTYEPHRWQPPSYTVDEKGKVVGGYTPTEFNNWGRWGDDDKIGTLNLITSECVRAAAELVKRGDVVSLALPIDDTGPRWSGRPAPKHYFSMTGSDAVAGLPHSAVEPGVTFTDDYIDMALQASTQWDGFAHWAYKDVLYNGYWVGNITAAGSTDLEMSALKERFVGRGVLLDVAAHLGVDHVEPGTAITPETLDQVLDSQGTEIRTGDIALIRTGHLGYWFTLECALEKERWYANAPGLSRTTARWLYDHDIAAMAIDTNGAEVVPFEDPVDPPHPIHKKALIDMGLPIGELWWLDHLAEKCASENRYEFLLSAPPLNIPGAVGSVLNPIVIM